MTIDQNKLNDMDFEEMRKQMDELAAEIWMEVKEEYYVDGYLRE